MMRSLLAAREPQLSTPSTKQKYLNIFSCPFSVTRLKSAARYGKIIHFITETINLGFYRFNLSFIDNPLKVSH